MESSTACQCLVQLPHLLFLWCLGPFWDVYGLYLHVRVVFLVIVLSEAITVTQQEAATKQPNSLSYLEIFGGIILIHFLWGNLQNATGKRLCGGGGGSQWCYMNITFKKKLC